MKKPTLITLTEMIESKKKKKPHKPEHFRSTAESLN